MRVYIITFVLSYCSVNNIKSCHQVRIWELGQSELVPKKKRKLPGRNKPQVNDHSIIKDFQQTTNEGFIQVCIKSVLNLTAMTERYTEYNARKR